MGLALLAIRFIIRLSEGEEIVTFLGLMYKLGDTDFFIVQISPPEVILLRIDQLLLKSNGQIKNC